MPWLLGVLLVLAALGLFYSYSIGAPNKEVLAACAVIGIFLALCGAIMGYLGSLKTGKLAGGTDEQRKQRAHLATILRLFAAFFAFFPAWQSIHYVL